MTTSSDIKAKDMTANDRTTGDLPASGNHSSDSSNGQAVEGIIGVASNKTGSRKTVPGDQTAPGKNTTPGNKADTTPIAPEEPAKPAEPPQLAPELYLNRELSWIEFNYRVLAQALNEHTPLLEQAKFSAIFSNNLDEFFMVRVASLKSQIEAGVSKLSDDGLTPIQQLEAIQRKLRPLLDLQQEHYRHSLKSNLAEYGVHLIDYANLNTKQRQWLDDYFRTAIFPVLTPLAVDPSHPFPFVSNLSLNVAALVRDPVTGQQQFARVKVPQKNIPRFVHIPPNLSDKDPEPLVTAVPLEQVVAFNLGLLFPGMRIEAHYFFRVTRDADLELRDLEADDLMEALEEGLRKRRRGGEVVRLEVANEMPEAVIEQLMEGIEVEPADVYRISGPLGLDDLMSLLSIPLPQLKDKPHKGRTAPALARAQKTKLEDGSIKTEEFQSIFQVIRRGDVLLHHPFDLFSTSVQEFLNQAAADPSVLAIKMTLYRTSKDSPVVAALIRAAENGKQVMALVELKARFDEDNNIQWAKQLESSGVHVVYGVLGLKTHTKILLVVRREKERLNTYVHVGTGNYNSKTSSLYTDIGLLTARPEFGADMVELFNYLTGFSKQQSFRRLLVAPVTLRAGMEALIRREIEQARAGRGGHLRAKMNSLVDPAIIALLYEASQAGVRIELVVRGMCSLRPGLKGTSDNIRVVSVIGRFLEHSRLFWFANGGQPEMFLGSADWMPRNLDRRVEAVAPVDDPRLRQQLEQLLDLYLKDTGAWHMDSDGRFSQRQGDGEELLVQQQLLSRWRGGLSAAPA
jgi:polyphosphate kinase